MHSIISKFGYGSLVDKPCSLGWLNVDLVWSYLHTEYTGKTNILSSCKTLSIPNSDTELELRLRTGLAARGGFETDTLPIYLIVTISVELFYSCKYVKDFHTLCRTHQTHSKRYALMRFGKLVRLDMLLLKKIKGFLSTRSKGFNNHTRIRQTYKENIRPAMR